MSVIRTVSGEVVPVPEDRLYIRVTRKQPDPMVKRAGRTEIRRIEVVRGDDEVFGYLSCTELKLDFPLNGVAEVTLSTPHFEDVFDAPSLSPAELEGEGTRP